MSINIVSLHLNGKYHYHSKIIMGKFKSYLNVGIIAAVLKDGKNKLDFPSLSPLWYYRLLTYEWFFNIEMSKLNIRNIHTQ